MTRGLNHGWATREGGSRVRNASSRKPWRLAGVLSAFVIGLAGCGGTDPGDFFDDASFDPFDPLSSETASPNGGAPAAGQPAANVRGELAGVDPGTPQSLPAEQPTSNADALRFTEQASFGPTSEGVAEVAQKGRARALEEQFYKTTSTYQDLTPVYSQACGSGSGSTCQRDNYSAYLPQVRFFRNAVHGDDQLRQRVAFALGQILVVSNAEIERGYGIAHYQQMLVNLAFGNYRDILREVTLSPVMGQFLNMVNNQKADPARGTEPNENYARELLQLFSIGEVLLNPDGTRQLDAQQRPIPTYDQDIIEAFARVFTGWTFPTRPGQTRRWPNPENFVGRMEVFADRHDTGTKTLLFGLTLAANQTPDKDLDDAISNVFNHPNVGPFIGKQLIQHLVTSNPSPAYVARVTAAFNSNAQGVRGDMKSVLRAILLDPEATGDAKPDADYGKLREPVLLMTGVVRGLGGSTDGVYLRAQSEQNGQFVFEAPTVFNFYSPDYMAPGTTDLLGPPFKVMHTGTILRRTNFLNELLFTNAGAIRPVTDYPNATGTTVNLAGLQSLAGTPDALVDRLNATLMPGTLSSADRQAIVTAINAVPATDAPKRTRTAVYLVATSPQYNVTR